MQILQTPHLFTFPKTLTPKPHLHTHHLPWRPLLPTTIISTTTTTFQTKCYSYDEVPVDEDPLEKYRPKDPQTEEEFRRTNWIDYGWAPWDEVLSYEADFARKSLEEGYEVPLKNPEAIEAFKMLSPKYRKQKMEELGLTEDEFYRKQFEIKGEKPEPLSTSWMGPLVLQLIPPRDWPPRGWEVDREELEFIRGAHKLQANRVDIENVESRVNTDTSDMNLERYKMFLKQYKVWVAANKDRLEKESYELDQDYYPGRRKRGKDYKEGMYELPFYYPGQICEGTVTLLNLYQGAFVDIGGVYDGWVPIKGNDWYWIRHHIKVGMSVIVEILAKRDPYRYRFPIEMRFVHPNIDHMIFNRFDFPPIFHRDEDSSPDEILRDGRRPLTPRKRLETKPEDEPLLMDHPYVDKIWQIHNAEQMIIDDFELNPEKYKGQKLSELTDDSDFDEENNIEFTTAPYEDTTIPKMIVKTSIKELDLEAALAERKLHIKLREEAIERGEKYEIGKLRRNHEMDEYDIMHWRRSFEEREALIRDISCRQALGLPVEEPGRYKDESYFAKEQKYNPTNPLYHTDFWGEPEESEKSMKERKARLEEKLILGKSRMWYGMSYEEAMKHKPIETQNDVQEKSMKKHKPIETQNDVQGKSDEDDEDEDGLNYDDDIFNYGEEEEDDEDDDMDLSILSQFNNLKVPQSRSKWRVVHGAEFSDTSDADD